MVVKYKLTLVVFVSWLLASNVSCATKQKDIEIIERVTTNYKNPLADYEKQLKYCEDKSNKNRLNREIFKGVKLTQLQLNIAIGRFY